MATIKGTKEWAAKNINLFTGDCPNGCIYCYAKANNHRFNKPSEYRVKEELLTKTFRKRDYLTMYPSAHDIRFADIYFHLTFLKNFLKSGSPILIVSKPTSLVVSILCHELMPFRDQIEFRFTIGSYRNDVLAFYEPNAPNYDERFAASMVAWTNGFKVSLSIEPMLDTHPDRIIKDVKDFITGDIWVGKLNHPKARLVANGHRDKIDRVMELAEWQSKDENILRIVERLSKYPNLRWKDSIQEVIKRN